MTRLIAALAFLCLFYAAPAAATGLQYCASDGTYRTACGQPETRILSHPSASGEGVIGRRPAGCPHRYCGCAVSLKVFGRMVDGLNLAANWKRRFPRTSPAPGMVAARSGHVFYIQSMIDANTALAWDPNSGGGKIRIHPRPLQGYTVVDPHGSQVASND